MIEKTEEQKKKIDKRISTSFMFSALDLREKKIVIDAMDEKKFSRGEAVINQGDLGDDLFVVDSGYLECFIKAAGQAEKLVKSYSQGDSFGELALLYNAPRYSHVNNQSSHDPSQD